MNQYYENILLQLKSDDRQVREPTATFRHIENSEAYCLLGQLLAMVREEHDVPFLNSAVGEFVAVGRIFRAIECQRNQDTATDSMLLESDRCVEEIIGMLRSTEEPTWKNRLGQAGTDLTDLHVNHNEEPASLARLAGSDWIGWRVVSFRKSPRREVTLSPARLDLRDSSPACPTLSLIFNSMLRKVRSLILHLASACGSGAIVLLCAVIPRRSSVRKNAGIWRSSSNAGRRQLNLLHSVNKK